MSAARARTAEREAAALHDAPAPLLGSVRRETLLVVGVMAAAFLLRLVYVLQMRSSPFFDDLRMDALYHVQWAQAFARGEVFQDGPFFRAPLYPWFLGTLFAGLGDGLLAPRIAQCALGAATTGLVHLIGRRAFDPRTGLVASIVAASYWILIVFDGDFLLETLSTPLNLLALWLTLGLAERRTPVRTLLAGAAWGLAAITRPNVLLVVPAVAAWVLVLEHPVLRAGLARSALLGLGALLPVLPIAGINASRGDAVLISSQAGVNLWIGNNPASDGSTAVVPGTRPDWWGGYHDAVAQAEAAEGRALRPSEVSAHYARRARSFLFGEPGSSVPHLLWKARLFWCDAELGNNTEVRFLAERFAPLVRWLPLGWGLLAPLGVLGLALSLRGGAARFPLAAYLVLYSGSVVLFFVNARFRVPVVPVLAIYAAHAALWCAAEARSRRFGRLAVAGALLALGVVSSRAVPDSILPPEAGGHLLLGQAAADAGRHAEALEHYRSAIAAWDRNQVAHRDLARSLAALGRDDDARLSLDRALVLAPDDVETLDVASELHRAGGRIEEAAEAASRSVSLAPHNPRGHFNLGQCAFARGRWEEAIRSFATSQERGAGTPFAFYAANARGATELRLQRFADAARSYRAALAARDPATDEGAVQQALQGLVTALVGGGMGRKEAEREAARAAGLAPG